MAHRWAADGLNESSEVQEFLDLAFSMVPHSPYIAERFVDEIGKPPSQIEEWAWDQVRWPRSGAAVPKIQMVAVVVWDLKQWAAQVREEPMMIAIRVHRSSIECLGVRPKPIARHLSKELSSSDDGEPYFGDYPY